MYCQNIKIIVPIIALVLSAFALPVRAVTPLRASLSATTQADLLKQLAAVDLPEDPSYSVVAAVTGVLGEHRPAANTHDSNKLPYPQPSLQIKAQSRPLSATCAEVKADIQYTPPSAAVRQISLQGTYCLIEEAPPVVWQASEQTVRQIQPKTSIHGGQRH